MKTQHTKSNGSGEPIVVELVETNVLIRWDCHACGGTTEKVTVLAEVKIGEHEGFRVCEQCLQLGEDEIETRMAQHAASLVGQAAVIHGMIGRLKVPTYQEWEERVRRREV